jgi:hypothetical protein
MKKANLTFDENLLPESLNSTLEFIIREQPALILRVETYKDEFHIYSYRLGKDLGKNKKKIVVRKDSKT